MKNLRGLIFLAIILVMLMLFASNSEALIIRANQTIKEADVTDLAKQSPNLVIIVDQKGCGACEIAKDYIISLEDKAIVYAFIDAHFMPRKYLTSGATPTFIIFKNGKYKGEIVGVLGSAKDLSKSITKLLNK